MDAISVIVPAHNNAATIGRSLQSIENAIAFFRAHSAEHHDVEIEIVVVDDRSTDETGKIVADIVTQRAFYKQVQGHHGSAASSRNIGVHHSKGNILFFLDGDDLYLPSHLHECYRALSRHRCGYIRSLIRIAGPVHPEWRDAIANSSMINLCVRRDCHEFLGGVPDFHLFSRNPKGFQHFLNLCPQNEDVYYNHLLVAFFHGYRLQAETVEYLRYPGNSLDRQFEKFCQPWGTVHDQDTPDEACRKQLAAQVLQWRRLQLTQSLQSLGPQRDSMPFKAE